MVIVAPIFCKLKVISMGWNCCIGRPDHSTKTKPKLLALHDLFFEKFLLTKPSDGEMSTIVEENKGFK